MITAIDTNIIEALWTGSPSLSSGVRQSLEQASVGSLVVAPPVYAELLAAAHRDAEAVDAFLLDKRIEIAWTFGPETWRGAAAAFRAYAIRRRQQHGDSGPRRILADFMIGAHALQHASALITFDDRIYRSSFPGLTLIVPGQ